MEMEIDVEIDELTNCLFDRSNGNTLDTEYRLVGVGAHLFAIACKHSWDAGNEGYVQFTAKTNLIEHYKTTLHANLIDQKNMYIDSYGAIELIHKYFKEGD